MPSVHMVCVVNSIPVSVPLVPSVSSPVS